MSSAVQSGLALTLWLAVEPAVVISKPKLLGLFPYLTMSLFGKVFSLSLIWGSSGRSALGLSFVMVVGR